MAFKGCDQNFSGICAACVIGGQNSLLCNFNVLVPCQSGVVASQVSVDFCQLFGTTSLFDAATMAARYVDRAGYVSAVSNAVDEGIARGTLLADDGGRIVEAAGLQWDTLAP